MSNDAQNAGVADTAAGRERVTQETASSVPPATDLVLRLRGNNPENFCEDEMWRILQDIHDAADRIEALERRVAELEQECDRLTRVRGTWSIELAKASQRAVKAERRVAELERAKED